MRIHLPSKSFAIRTYAKTRTNASPPGEYPYLPKHITITHRTSSVTITTRKCKGRRIKRRTRKGSRGHGFVRLALGTVQGVLK